MGSHKTWYLWRDDHGHLARSRSGFLVDLKRHGRFTRDIEMFFRATASYVASWCAFYMRCSPVEWILTPRLDDLSTFLIFPLMLWLGSAAEKNPT